MKYPERIKKFVKSWCEFLNESQCWDETTAFKRRAIEHFPELEFDMPNGRRGRQYANGKSKTNAVC